MKLEELVGKPITEAQFDEAAGKKDACYHKVKARYDVWPSAYASGALVKCRKVGAANWGNSKKEVAEGTTQKFKSAVIDKAVKIAKSMGGNMTAAVKKIEKIEKNLSKNGRVEYALQQANEGLDDLKALPKDLKKSIKKKREEGVNEASMELKKLEDAIKMFQKKIKKQGSVTNARDEDHLKNLIKVYKQMGGKGVKEGLGDRMSKKLKKHKGVNLKKKKIKLKGKSGRGKISHFGMEGFASNAQRRAAFASGYKAKGKKKKKEGIEEARGTCWVGYQQLGMKKKGGKMVPNCVKEITEIFYEVDGKGYGYTFEHINDGKLNEAEYQGRKVKLGKIMQGDAKKFKVYVKNPKGNVVKVNFGQGGKAKGGTMKIRKSNPKARKSFRARHNCDNPGPRHKARYWSCRKW